MEPLRSHSAGSTAEPLLVRAARGELVERAPCWWASPFVLTHLPEPQRVHLHDLESILPLKDTCASAAG